jgi:hypothetical protein
MCGYIEERYGEKAHAEEEYRRYLQNEIKIIEKMVVR